MVAVDLDSSDSQATNDPDTPWRRDQAWGWGSQPATDLQDDTPTVDHALSSTRLQAADTITEPAPGPSESGTKTPIQLARDWAISCQRPNRNKAAKEQEPVVPPQRDLEWKACPWEVVPAPIRTWKPETNPGPLRRWSHQHGGDSTGGTPGSTLQPRARRPPLICHFRPHPPICNRTGSAWGQEPLACCCKLWAQWIAEAPEGSVTSTDWLRCHDFSIIAKQDNHATLCSFWKKRLERRQRESILPRCGPRPVQGQEPRPGGALHYCYQFPGVYFDRRVPLRQPV